MEGAGGAEPSVVSLKEVLYVRSGEHESSLHPETQTVIDLSHSTEAPLVTDKRQIIMGYNVATTLSISKESGDANKNVEGELAMTVKAIAASGSAKVDLSTVDNHMKENVSVRISGDFELASLPHTLERVAEFNEKIPRLVPRCNRGLGVPKRIFLVPLTLFKRWG